MVAQCWDELDVDARHAVCEHDLGLEPYLAALCAARAATLCEPRGHRERARDAQPRDARGMNLAHHAQIGDPDVALAEGIEVVAVAAVAHVLDREQPGITPIAELEVDAAVPARRDPRARHADLGLRAARLDLGDLALLRARQMSHAHALPAERGQSRTTSSGRAARSGTRHSRPGASAAVDTVAPSARNSLARTALHRRA